MRFLVDAQLPPALARHLNSDGHHTTHVLELGLERASDRDIWRWALDNNANILTKDEDFVTLRALSPNGPAVIWIRFGNTTRDTLIRKLSPLLPSIISAVERGETVIEVAEK